MTLQKFLLAWSDLNWFWLYGRLRPAPAARWSLPRAIVLALSAGGLGALLGLLIALAAIGRPVGWLPWLLGLWGACAGVCWFGVTALCWNRRAALSRSDPTLPTKMAKARYPFFRGCLGFIYTILLGVVTPLALLVTVENIRGEIVWKHARARLVAAGEKLAFREILGPEIPAEMNAGAASIFAPLFDYERASDPAQSGVLMSRPGWRQHNHLEFLRSAFMTPSSYLPESAEDRAQAVPKPFINVSDWATAYREAQASPRPYDRQWARTLRLPDGGQPAEVVLAGLAGAEQPLAEVCAAAALPRARFPVSYQDGFRAFMPHLTGIQDAQRILRLRCAAHLAAGGADAAFADATNALNVAEILREEPLLFSQITRYAQWSIALGTVWQGLARHGWTDAHLAFFQERLQRVDMLPGLLLAFEGDFVITITGMEQLIHDPRIYHDSMGGDSRVGRLPRVLTRGILRGVLRQNQTALAHLRTMELASMRRAFTNTTDQGLLALLEWAEAQLELVVPFTYSPYSVLVRQFEFPAGNIVIKGVRAQTAVQLAIVACALERHRLAHGEFPGRLDQLAPFFPDGVPLDPVVNRPFRYQRTDDGWFLLYSVGPNGVDDGGVMRVSDARHEEDKDWPWPVPARPAQFRLF